MAALLPWTNANGRDEGWCSGDGTTTDLVVGTLKDGRGGSFDESGSFDGSGECDTNAVKANCDSRVSLGSIVWRGARHWSTSGTPRSPSQSWHLVRKASTELARGSWPVEKIR